MVKFLIFPFKIEWIGKYYRSQHLLNGGIGRAIRGRQKTWAPPAGAGMSHLQNSVANTNTERAEMSLNPKSGDSIDEKLSALSKSKNKAKNDAKRAAKLEKFLAKQSRDEKFKAPSASVKPKSLNVTSNDVCTHEIDTTPVGEKKDLSKPMASSYDPPQVEATWYAWWERSGFFKPECHGLSDEQRENFTIIMPPPNVTGSLHLGHAIMLSIQDSLARW